MAVLKTLFAPHPPQGHEGVDAIRVDFNLLVIFYNFEIKQVFTSYFKLITTHFILIGCSLAFPNNAAILHCREWKDTGRKCSSENINQLLEKIVCRYPSTGHRLKS